MTPRVAERLIGCALVSAGLLAVPAAETASAQEAAAPAAVAAAVEAVAAPAPDSVLVDVDGTAYTAKEADVEVEIPIAQFIQAPTISRLSVLVAAALERKMNAVSSGGADADPRYAG